MKHQFKPFDQVLVRDADNEKWYPAHYKYYDDSNPETEYPHICDTMGWKCCIPYNEETAHLVNTCEPYQEPEPIIWRVIDIQTEKIHEMTQTQFNHFIKDVLGSDTKCCYQIGRINN